MTVKRAESPFSQRLSLPLWGSPSCLIVVALLVVYCRLSVSYYGASSDTYISCYVTKKKKNKSEGERA